MKHKQEHSHMVDILFVLTLFCTFTISALMLVNIGAQVYKQTVKSMDDNFSTRTVFAYLTEKIRQNDNTEAVSAGMLEDVPAVIITQKIQDISYCTYLYMDEGYLKELFTMENADLSGSMKAAGQKIMTIRGFALEEITPGLYHFRLVADNRDFLSLYIHTRSQ